ncbi:predicted protein [Aspergillus terreus NIH2624]|uniref:Uncharacterized protein n=1 Tax=Aspergillus terreus (strain NIH 2624 / FGSC A1156) TaxID=341663 RepID=Q0CEU6_ASPTN|nr:uncharacterized protein ATEG_07788 [Aspergillus terreus NIH2624]EAU32050.1 predicted protein [Aspergillus terreus NIH2624]
MASRHDGIDSEDWPEESLSRRSSLLHGRGLIADQGLNTGVRVMDDGRLDINFHKRKPLLGKLQKHLQTAPYDRRPSAIHATEEKEHFPLRLNIVIQVVGSQGDVQPFVILGKELKKHGHRVRLATHLSFNEYVNEQGLEFFNIGGDPAELMAFMVKNPGLMPDMRTIRSGAIQRRRRDMKTIFTGCWRSCFETGDGTGLHHIRDDPWSDTVDYRDRPFVADVIIANPPSFAHISCAEKLGIPLNMMFTMPWTATQAFPHPLANIRSGNTKPSAANFASYAIVEIMMWEGLGDLINRFRKRELGLDPLDAIRAPSIAHRLRVPFTYLWSPALLPKPKDWDDSIDVCGFQFYSSGSDYQPPEELDAFLKAGPPPIYVGFGSIVVDNAEKLTEIVFEAVRRSGQRAIVSKGWGNIGAGETEIPDNILLIGKCPHDWLFQHVSCVIHHGGAGTTAAGLLAGRPTIVIPFFGDQPFWGSIVARAGAGPLPVPYKQLTVEKLTEAIQTALKPETLEKAGEIGAEMRMENGMKNAVSSFHQHLDIDSLRCSLCPKRPAVWFIQHSHIKLSAFAATVLVETGLLKPHNIVLYRPQEYDTTRDPKGPLSAGAEVLYGVVTDFISGLASVPIEMSEAVSWRHNNHFSDRGHHRHRHHHHHRHPPEDYPGGCPCLRKSGERGQASTDLTGGTQEKQPPRGEDHLQRWEQEVDQEGHEDGEDSTSEEGEEGSDTSYESAEDRLSNSEGASSDTTVADPEGLGNCGQELDLEKTMTRHLSKDLTSTQIVLSETGYHAGKFAKQVLNWVLLLPTDLTLSLSKGFHNAPKLYHDKTVLDTPKVRGVRSGFRAAGTEFTQSFYHGITGLVTQPARGFSETGPKGLVKGMGKGIGGVFFKPIGGLWGLAGYPLSGIHKSLRNSISKSKTKEILQSRLVQGVEEMCAATTEERAEVIRRWHEIQKHDRASAHSNGHAG